MDGTNAGLFWLEWQYGTLVLVGTAVCLFARGWQKRANPSNKNQDIYTRRRMVSFYASIFFIILALCSPFYNLATRYFSIHVAQHILLMALIPCLLTVSNPLPILKSGLPKILKKLVQRIKLSQIFERYKESIIQITSPGVAFVLATVSFWIWYDPQIHQLTLQYAWVHRFETTLLFFVALFYWWHILGAEPRLHKRMPPVIRILYTMIGTWPIKIVGLILLFTSQSVYQYPPSYQFSGLNINDQGVGAIIVWALGGFVFSTTATILARDWLHTEEMKPIDPTPAWQTDQAMRAPGFPIINHKR